MQTLSICIICAVAYVHFLPGVVFTKYVICHMWPSDIHVTANVGRGESRGTNKAKILLKQTKNPLANSAVAARYTGAAMTYRE